MDLYQYPFTQIYEDCMMETRESSVESKVKSRFKRRVNQVYQSDVPSRYEWDWLRKTGTITLVDDYSTGTIAVSVAGSTVTGTGTTWTEAAHDGLKMKIDGNDQVYTATYSTSTSITISPAFTGATALTASTYTLYQDKYALPAGFGRWPTTSPKVYQYINGNRREVKWASDKEFRRRYTWQPTSYPTYWREHPDKTSLDLYQIEISPPSNVAGILELEYIATLPAMVEWTGTTHGTTACTTTKVVTTADMPGVVVGMYLRGDPTNFGEYAEWVKITAVAADTSTGDGITVATHTVLLETSKAITVCSVPAMPYTLQKALFYGACMITALEQNDEAVEGYAAAYKNALDADMSRRSRKRYGKQAMQIGNWR